MGWLSILFLLALYAAIAEYTPSVDLEGQPGLDGEMFWCSILIGLLASVAFLAARAVWRRSTRR